MDGWDGDGDGDQDEDEERGREWYLEDPVFY